jgi:DNA replication protein DnaC
MNTNATLERLGALKLHGMERSLQTLLDTRLLPGLEGPELLAQLVDAEWDERRERRSSRLIRAACFHTASSLTELEFAGGRSLDRAAVAPYADCRWVTAADVFIITGPTGIGKSFLAQALGLQACLMGHATRYFNARKLFPTLRRHRKEGTYKRFIDRLAKTPVLILDDFGLEVLEPEDRLALFEIVEDRAGKLATIIASQVPVSLWFERIGEPTVADAICDRLVHRAIRFDLKGDSRRKAAVEAVPKKPIDGLLMSRQEEPNDARS